MLSTAARRRHGPARGDAEDRKRVLTDGSEVKRILYSEHLEEEGARIFYQACLMKLEGIVAKLWDALYRSGRTESWLKIKCAKREAFPIVGLVPRVGGIAALPLARRGGDQLLYVGKADTGSLRRWHGSCATRLDRMKRARSRSPRRCARRTPHGCVLI
jgi:bifunctional non-homologous end joining protein LigD